MSAATCLSVYVLTEDSSGDAHDTLVALLKRSFRLVDSACQTQRVRFLPGEPQERAAMAGNLWKARQGRARQASVDLARGIATRLLQAATEPTFVVIHVDGDRAWSAQHTSENVKKLDALLAKQVKGSLLQHHKGDEQAVQSALGRVLRVFPFYSVEAWLYQNIAEAQRICAVLGAPPKLVDQLAAWRDDPGALDEITTLKDSCALGGEHNRRLAQQWPAPKARSVGKSYAAFVDELEACAPLVDALKTTWSA